MRYRPFVRVLCVLLQGSPDRLPKVELLLLFALAGGPTITICKGENRAFIGRMKRSKYPL